MEGNKRIAKSKKLFIFGSILSTLSIFLMFAPALSWYHESFTTNHPNLFMFAFGYYAGGFAIPRVPGMTALFCFELLSIICVFFVLTGINNKVLGEGALPIFAGCGMLFSLIALILAFSTRSVIGLLSSYQGGYPVAEATLGVGSILIGCTQTLSLGLNGLGLFYHLR